MDPLSYFSFQPVLHNSEMVHLKESLLLIKKLSCPKTLDWISSTWSCDGHVWTFSGYGHINSLPNLQPHHTPTSLPPPTHPPHQSKRVDRIVLAVGFLSDYLRGPLPYVQRHLTLTKMSASLNKTFPSFLPNLSINSSVNPFNPPIHFLKDKVPIAF